MTARDRLAAHLASHPDQRAAVAALFDILTPVTLRLVAAALAERHHERDALTRIETILAEPEPDRQP
jgi:hypothetical protein